MIAYILISMVSASIGAVLCGLLHNAYINRELEELKRTYENVTRFRQATDTPDAEIAYLEYLFGVDDYVRSRNNRGGVE